MKFYTTILVLSLIATVSCKQDTVVASPSPVKDTIVRSEVKQAEEPLQDIAYEDMQGTTGIITTAEGHSTTDVIPVYDSLKNRISEIALTDEYQILKLRCLKKDGMYYKVRLDDNSIGYVPNNPDLIAFQTWEQHLLKVFCVGFNPKDNPLRQGPSATAATGPPYTDDNFYHPHKVQGDWLQVSYGYDDNAKYAWIKWKENNRLLVEFYYFA